MTSIRDEEIPEMKVGDIFYECEMGMNIEAEVTSIPVESACHEGRRFWKWTAKNTQTGEEISYAATEGLTHYGPRLYTSPEYAHFIDGKTIFKLVGANQQEKSQ